MSYGLGNDSSQVLVKGFRTVWMRGSHHGVSLAAACLTVGKHRAVIAFDDALDEREASLVIDFLLMTISAIY